MVYVTIRLEQQKGTERGWVEMMQNSLKGYISAQEIGEKQFLTNSEGNENPKVHEHKIRQTKKPFGTTSSLMTTDRYQKPTPNCFYCKKPHWSDECHNISTLQERKKRPKEDAAYVFTKDMKWRNVKLRNHVTIARRRRVTTGACVPDYSSRKSLHPTAFSQLTQPHLR